ncbi:unnamed protein product [Nezara viridula]|uniref:Deoxyhypusine hydroxylase n=1 Tax=Nezara viridula TaxID=85310 RepID=A0A9P0HJA9_NEZVI|nr:unnamed protein product [Nezara viridula]
MTHLADKVKAIGKVLNDPERPLKERFRALFTLKNIGGHSALEAISDCFQDSSALLKHELAYCLGQMQDPEALPVLYGILSNLEEHPMVRHEAGEAIGAICNENSLPILKRFIDDPAPEVSETCQLAIQRIEWFSKNNDRKKSVYNTVDPTPSLDLSDVKSLKEILLNDEIDLFDRYKAMFALRDINSPESILALCEGLFVGGALFRHEIAFVLGQLQNEISIPHLIKALEDLSQNEMVRHECAEALGSIANEECFNILRVFLNDESRVVRESCDVALDMADYAMSNEFQYANTALLVQSV